MIQFDLKNKQYFKTLHVENNHVKFKPDIRFFLKWTPLKFDCVHKLFRI